MQADVVATGLRRIRLQEPAVRVQLDREQVRRAEDARTLAKVLTDALLFGERVSHMFSRRYAPTSTGSRRPRPRVPALRAKESKCKSNKSNAQPAADAVTASSVGLRVWTAVTT